VRLLSPTVGIPTDIVVYPGFFFSNMCRFHRVKQTILKSELHTLITLLKRFESEKKKSVICYESEGTIERERPGSVLYISPHK